ncbi:uncharacterized protein LOC110036308 isoform X2 [Phalaenopsis equestris]|uniref:uncharacterized protein LOC110036308 isoform X2 n=1 Tax=Phalaenopsis equestris TaxID=78828 RepID=UPI0009E4A529|nr:uncharacterized protein LOC110036308 isoform X2 [Phalaenopsis equestris]
MAEKAEAIAGDAEKRVMVVAFDDSEHSIYALHWTLRHFFAGAHGGGPLTDVYKLLILHAAAGPSPVIGLGGPGVAAVLPKVESELWKISDQVIEKAREICVSNSLMWHMRRSKEMQGMLSVMLLKSSMQTCLLWEAMAMELLKGLCWEA